MSSKELRTRIQLKNDTASNWNVASNNGFIPKLGEPIFYREENTDKIIGMKMGDGEHTPNELAFVYTSEVAYGFRVTANTAGTGAMLDFDDEVVFVFDAGTSTTNLSEAMRTEVNNAGGTTAIFG